MYFSVLNTPPTAAICWASWSGTEHGDATRPAGQVGVGLAGDIVFALSDAPPSEAGVLGCTAVDLPLSDCALRIDEVAFPVGAIAHRHTHSGFGWRHLISGALRIEADNTTEVMHPGASWFEPAGSPVRAVAQHQTGVSRFVRAMVIPKSFIGRSTFALRDPDDAALPRLQITHRHIDHVLQVDAG